MSTNSVQGVSPQASLRQQLQLDSFSVQKDGAPAAEQQAPRSQETPLLAESATIRPTDGPDPTGRTGLPAFWGSRDTDADASKRPGERTYDFRGLTPDNWKDLTPDNWTHSFSQEVKAPGSFPGNIAPARTEAITTPVASGLSPAVEQFAVKSLVAAVLGGAQPSPGSLSASDAAKAKTFVSDFVDQATQGLVEPSKDGVRRAAIAELKRMAAGGDANATAKLPLLENLKVKGSDVQSVQPTVPNFSDLSLAAKKYVVGSVLSGVETGKALSTKGLSQQDAQAGGAVLEKFLGQVNSGSITSEQQPVRIAVLGELQIRKLNADPKNEVQTNNLKVMTELFRGLEVKAASPAGDAASQPIQQLTPNAEKFVVKALLLVNESVPKGNLPPLTDPERKAASTAASQILRGVQAQNIDPAYQDIVKAVIAALKADPSVDPAKITALETALDKSPKVPQ